MKYFELKLCGHSAVHKKTTPSAVIPIPDSMSETKTKYIVQFGIGPYVIEQLIEDLAKTPFTFMFDETTTSQVKKQYDGYVQFYSKRYKRLINQYAGSLFLGHCTSEQFKDHFMQFMLKL